MADRDLVLGGDYPEATQRKEASDPASFDCEGDSDNRLFFFLLLSIAFSLIYHQALLPQACFLVLTALSYGH